MRALFLSIAIWCGLAATAAAQPAAEQRLVFVMIDGLRWQEVFRGADSALADDPNFVKSDWAPVARERFVQPTERRHALMPFMTDVIAKQGILLGDRGNNSCARVTNDFWFSYPGYNEALTGKPDLRIDKNDFGPNPNTTFLEWLNKRPAYAGKVRAYASWDHFRDIINAPRSGVPVNDGYVPSGAPGLELADRLLADTASPWRTVRLDAFTMLYAQDGLARFKPRVTFISFGETDDFAHEGDYAQYLIAANRTDRFLRELWEGLQRDPDFAGVTTMIVTVDHGRGDTAEGWRHHSSARALSGVQKQQFPNGITGSEQSWMAVIGPRVRPAAAAAYTARKCADLNQLTATALTALGEDWRSYSADIGKPLDIFAKR
jgi:hypothetical protein